jgi:hypothetical protein
LSGTRRRIEMPVWRDSSSLNENRFNFMSITPQSLEGTWSQIRSKLPHADGSLVLEQALIHGEVGLSAVVRVRDSLPGIVIRVPSRWSFTRWQVQRLSGVHFEPAIQEHEDILLPVMLADADGAWVFANFSADISSSVLGECSLEEKMRRLMKQIGLWRRFFQHRNDGLSEEEVRGLIGELDILGCLIRNFGVDAAMESWRGPRGELHDFHLSSFRIEVKTWINESLPRIFISDPSQIVIDTVWPVWMSAVQLSTDNTAGSTLPDRVALLAAKMSADQKITFETLLADVGYLASHAGIYTRRYSVRETVFYLIMDGFPLIDPATIPGGITCLRYALELGALAPYALPSPI